MRAQSSAPGRLGVESSIPLGLQLQVTNNLADAAAEAGKCALHIMEELDSTCFDLRRGGPAGKSKTPSRCRAGQVAYACRCIPGGVAQLKAHDSDEAEREADAAKAE